MPRVLTTGLPCRGAPCVPVGAAQTAQFEPQMLVPAEGQ